MIESARGYEVTVSFTAGWALGIDDITSSTAPSGQEDTTNDD